mgnify:CR=1 FL=1
MISHSIASLIAVIGVALTAIITVYVAKKNGYSPTVTKERII